MLSQTKAAGVKLPDVYGTRKMITVNTHRKTKTPDTRETGR